MHQLLTKIKYLFKKTSPPLVKVLVFKSRLLENLSVFQKQFSKVSFAPVLKSNAYGHGLFEVAKILQNSNVPFFVVDSLYEAHLLKNKGIKKSILIIGFTTFEQVKSINVNNIAITVVSLGQLEEFAKNLKRKTVFHLKIDTGMHRQGILQKDFEKTCELIGSNKNIIVEGLCSHFADADGENEEFTNQQIENWHKAIKFFKEKFSSIKYLHISNSAGVKFLNKIDANVVRLGIGLYGFDQSGKILGLNPVLEMRTVVSGIKDIQVNEYVGYNTTFQADKPMKIATLPVGYFEGVDRRLSNIGFVKIHGQFCKILGRVSMNIISVDATSIANVKVGDEATIISSESEDKNSIINIAKDCKTIPYEILVHVPQHLRRDII